MSTINPQSIHIARSYQEIMELKSFWEENQWHPNSDMDFYLNIIESRGEKAKPFIIWCCTEGKPKLMWIGRIEKKRIKIRLGYSVIAQPKVNMLTFIYGGIIGDQSASTIGEFLDYLSILLKRKEFDVILFQHIKKNSLLYESALKYQSFILRDYFPETFSHWKMTIPESMDDLYKRFSPKRRQEIKRQSRKIERDFENEISIKCFTNPEQVDQLIAETEIIAMNSYQRGMGTGFNNDLEMKNRLLLLAERGWLRGFILYIKNNPCAFNIGTVYKSRFNGNFTSFDRKYDKNTPGTYLLLYVIDSLLKEDVHTLDFGFGDAFYKSRFGDDKWDEAVLYLFSPTMKGLAVSFLRTITLIISKLGSDLFGNFTHKLKKYWRKRLIAET